MFSILVLFLSACNQDKDLGSTDSLDPSRDEDADGYSAQDDCDDSDPRVHPEAQETCDGVDQDCDGTIDDEAIDADAQGYLDEDLDGFGAGALLQACSRAEGWSLVDGDCDDTRADVFPTAAELCDGVDNNCDGSIDDADPNLDPSAGWTVYTDLDGDSYGQDGTQARVCEVQEGQATRSGDCDDSDPQVSPGAEEQCNDTLDNNCDASAEPCVTQDGELSIADARLLGALLTGSSGMVVDGGQDLNGDGILDVLVAGTDAAYLFPGPYSGDQELSTGLARFEGDSSTTPISFAVSAALLHDLNGDSQPDLVITDDRAVSAGADQGAAWIWYGPLSGQYTLDSADAVIWGEAPGDFFGHTVVDAGDLDGDSTPELLLGSVVGSPGGAGGCMLYEAPFVGISTRSDASAAFYSDSSGDYAGYTCAAVGDTDGDGRGEVVVASPVVDVGSGRVWLMRDAQGQVNVDDADLLVRSYDQDYLGYSVLGADIDSDGHNDLVLGAPFGSGIVPFSGAVFVVLAPGSGEMYVNSADVTLDSNQRSEQLGFSMAVQDLDQDGAVDLLVGAPGLAEKYNNAGGAYLWQGPVLASGDSTDADLRWHGENDFAAAGYDVALPGDLNQDGVGDLLIGAPGTNASAQRGAAYIVFPTFL